MQFASETALGSLAKPVDLCSLQGVLAMLCSVNIKAILNCHCTCQEQGTCPASFHE